MASLEIRTTPDGILWLTGEFDMAGVDTFRIAVETSVDPDGPAVLDLSGLRFLDSSGIRAIVACATEVAQGGLVLRDPQDGVRRVIELTGIEGRNGIRVEPAGTE